MAKNLNQNINLSFTADTNNAVNAIKKLKQELGNLSTGSTLRKDGIAQITPEIQKGIRAAGELKAKLESATNVNTGKLDLSKFSDSLKKSGTSLQQYASQLNALGPAGRQAFHHLTQSIMQAEAPLVRCSNRLKELGTSLANTARWQISSSVLHGFMGAISGAYRYAQDLNKSLNDIRIVTGANVDTMEKFAIAANRAARNLSTTTNEYAKASLIFFQQGNAEAEAMQKANVVTKMANVTGQTSEIVSNQLTAIWNNFNKAGDQSYEHYADVLTKLGAATATSTDEIANGLEKFAGIADTIGLSYNYAASALATITSVSRESEEVVGTALKTIFARMEGLKLGETLEDGTTLNQYSKTLQTVGVNLFDSNKELKTMDTLLTDVASVWKGLSKDNQIALAQGVAGIRQYNQFMTLMDNWNFMEKNLETAKNATGELQKQNEIYEEGWQAASKRVKAAAENLYTKIIDDDFFIDFLGGLESVIDGVGGVIDAFGGLKGVLFTIGAFATRIFRKEIAESLRNVAYNIQSFLNIGSKTQAMSLKTEALDSMKHLRSDKVGAEGEAENIALDRQEAMQKRLYIIAKDISEEELKSLQHQMDTVRIMDERAIAAAKIADETREEAEQLASLTRAYAKLEARQKAMQELGSKKNAEKSEAQTAKEKEYFDKGAIASQGNATTENNKENLFLKTQYEEAREIVREEQGLKHVGQLKLNDPATESQIREAFMKGIRSAAENGVKEAQQIVAKIEEAGTEAVHSIDAEIQERVKKAANSVNKMQEKSDAAAGTVVRARDLNRTAIQLEGTLKNPDVSVDRLSKASEILSRKLAAARKEAQSLQDALGEDADEELKQAIKTLEQLQQELEEAGTDAKALEEVRKKLSEPLGVTDILTSVGNQAGVDATADYFGESGPDTRQAEFFEGSMAKKTAEKNKDNAIADADLFAEDLDKSFDKAGQKTADWADGITKATSVVMGLGSAITSVQGAIDVFTNPDASDWDKFSAVMSVLIGLLPVLATMFTTVGTAGTAAGVGMTAAMGPVGWIIMAIVAAVAALTAAFIALSNAYNKDAINAKKAAENAEKLAEASQKVKEQLQGIKDGFDAYDTAVEKLNDCVRGTDEWNAALKEVNDTVINLLKTYPNLLARPDLFSRNEFGMLEISKENRDAIIEEAEKNAITAEAASLMGIAKASQARVKAETTETQRSIEGFSRFDFHYDGSSLITHKNELAGLKPDEFEAKLKEIYEKPAEMADWIYDDLIEHFKQYQGDIDKLVDSAKEAAIQMDNVSILIANSRLGEEYGEIETAAAAEAYEKEQKKLYENIIEQDANNNTQASGKTDTAKEIWGRFQAATGITYDLAENAVQGDDDNRTYAYIDKTGKEQTYTIEYIAETIAAHEALEAMDVAAEDAQKLLGELGEKGVGLAAALGKGVNASSVANYLSTMTQGELDTLGNSIERDSDGKVIVNDEFYSALGVSADEFASLAQMFGRTVDELARGIAEAHGNITSTLTDEDKAFFADNEIDTSSMTIGEQKEFIDNRNTFQTKAKDVGIAENQIDQIISDNKDMDPKQLNAFMTELNGISLNAEDAKDQIAGLTEKYNIQGGSIDGLITSVEALDQAYNTDTRNISAQAEVLKDIVGDGLNVGDIVSEEDMIKLRDAGVDIGTYFTQMSDGTYGLTGKAEEFNNVVKNITLQGLKDQLADFNTNAFQQALDKNPVARSGYIATNLRNTSVAQAFDKDVNGAQAGTDAMELGYSRLDYINSFDKGTFTFTEEQNNLLNAYGVNPNKAFTSDELAMIAEMMDVVNAKAIEVESQMFSTATSIRELHDIANDVGQYSLTSYGEGLINLASQYDNCSTEIIELQEAMLSGDETLIKTKIDALELSATIGELSNKYGLDAEDVETHAKLIQSTAKDYKLTAQQAANLAVANRRMNKGVQTLSDNWKDWSKILKTSDKNSMDYADTLNDANEALADLTGAVDASVIPMDFLDSSTEAGAEHLEWMSRAAKGDQQAINLLGVALADAQINAMQFDETMVKMAQDSGLLDKAFDTTAFQTYKDEVLQGITTLQDAIKNGTVAAGQNITELMNGNGETWVDSLNAMALATGMSVEEMNGMLNELGVQAKVDVQSVEQDMEVPTYTEVVKRNPEGIDTNEDGKPDAYGYMRYTIPGPPKRVKGWVQVAQISTEEGSIEPPQITYAGTGGGSVGGGVSPSSTSSGKKGGGSSKPKKTSEAKKKKSDIVERYKEVNDQLDDSSRAMDKASKSADRLFGADRLKAMDKINDALELEIKNLKAKKKETEEYLAIDKKALEEAAADMDLGIRFKYDDKGNITNYEEEMTKVYNAREALLNSFGDTIDEKEQEKLDAFDQKVENLTEKQTQYDDTREEKENTEEAIEDAYHQWQDNNYEKLNYKIEIRTEINDMELETLEYYLSKTEDDFYKRAEGLGYLTAQMGLYEQQQKDNLQSQAELEQAFADGKISQQAYAEGLKELRNQYKATAEGVQELDKAMMSYYGETLDMAAEELSKYTERLEHSTAVLEHYKNIVELTSVHKDKNYYQDMGKILDGQAKTIKNELSVAQKEYEFYESEAADKKKKWEEAIASGDDSAAELFKKEWEAAEAKSREAQDKMLSKTQEWAEAMKAVVENELAGLAQDLEDALTADFGGSFEALNSRMERAASLQEEYLTTTNKIYETNKMINTAQQAIDKTTNTVAKQRLKSFQQETAQLQSKSKLSKYELDIQQAKYDLLLAEIALEEAQQTKSTVRLQRDSEGNFGYVYTADANKTAEAEQQLADAQNALYNIGLEGANDYAQKYQQTMSEMYDTFTELHTRYLNGEFENEAEYNEAMTKAKEYYYQKLADYSDLYSIALTTDSRVVQDAWSSEFQGMVTNTEIWKTKVDGYLVEAGKSLSKWKDAAIEAKNLAGLSDVSTQVKTIADESKNLAQEITKEGGVIDAIKAQTGEVSLLTSEYAKLRQEFLDLGTQAEKSMQKVQGMYEAMAPKAKENDEKNNGSQQSDKSSDNNTTKNNTSSGTTTSGSNNNNTILTDGSKVVVKKTATHFSRNGGNGTRMQSWVPGYTFTVIDVDGNEVLIGKGNSYNLATGWVRKTDLEGFRTGGYTGSWGSEGKLAMLHQKELILNADDTTNFLASLEVLREIMKVIDLHSTHAQISGMLNSPTYYDYNEPQTLEQQVHIEASFPNVSDRNEIEEAMTNLINRASQFVNRK